MVMCMDRVTLAHAGLVTALLVVTAALLVATPADDGANIGAGFVFLLLVLGGLPWSVSLGLYTQDLFDPGLLGVLLWVGTCNAVNVAVVRRYRQRHVTRRGDG